MTYSPDTPFQADREPSEAPANRCASSGETRQPDPTDEFIGMLKELGHLGMRLARRIVVEAEQADVQAPEEMPEAPVAVTEPTPDDTAATKLLAERRAAWQTAALAHQRLTRSIRLCMVLAVKFHTDRLERETRIEAAESAARRERRKRLKAQLETQVRKTIERAAEEESERQIEAEGEDYDQEASIDRELALCEDLTERLDEDDIERDLGLVAQSELYGRICEGLGVQPDWARWRRVTGAMAAADAAALADEIDCGSPAAPEPEAVKPPAPEPDAITPEDPEPPEAKMPEPEPAVPKPEVPAAPPLYPSDPMKMPEYQRALATYQARLIDKHNNRLSKFD